MTNINAQHFVVSIHYESGDSDVFDPEGLGDLVYDGYCESDNIHRIEKVLTHEEPFERPTYDQLDALAKEYVPPHGVRGPDLAIASVVVETLAYALGRFPLEELHESIARAQGIAVPVTPDNLGRKPQAIRNQPPNG